MSYDPEQAFLNYRNTVQPTNSSDNSASQMAAALYAVKNAGGPDVRSPSSGNTPGSNPSNTPQQQQIRQIEPGNTGGDAERFLSDAQSKGYNYVNVYDTPGNRLGFVKTDKSGLDFINQLGQDQQLELRQPNIKSNTDINNENRNAQFRQDVLDQASKGATFDILDSSGKLVGTASNDHPIYDITKAEIANPGGVSVVARYSPENSKALKDLPIPDYIAGGVGSLFGEPGAESGRKIIKAGVGSFLESGAEIGTDVLAGIGKLTGGKLGIRSDVTQQETDQAIKQTYGESYLDDLLSGQKSNLTPGQQRSSLIGTGAFFGLGLVGGGKSVKTAAKPLSGFRSNNIIKPSEVIDRIVTGKSGSGGKIGTADIGLNIKPTDSYLNALRFKEQSSMLPTPGSVKVSSPVRTNTPGGPKIPDIISGEPGSGFSSTKINLGVGTGKMVDLGGKGGYHFTDFTKPSPGSSSGPKIKPGSEITSRNGLVQILKEPMVQTKQVFKHTPVSLGRSYLQTVKIKPVIKTNYGGASKAQLETLKYLSSLQTRRSKYRYNPVLEYGYEPVYAGPKGKLSYIFKTDFINQPKFKNRYSYDFVNQPKYKQRYSFDFVNRPKTRQRYGFDFIQTPKQKQRFVYVPIQVQKPKLGFTVPSFVPPTTRTPPPGRTPPTRIPRPRIRIPPIGGGFYINFGGTGGGKRKKRSSKSTFYRYNVGETVGDIITIGTPGKSVYSSYSSFKSTMPKIKFPKLGF